MEAPEHQYAALGPDRWNKTYYASGVDANAMLKPWYTVDASGQTLGRLAVLVANTIRSCSVLQLTAEPWPTPGRVTASCLAHSHLSKKGSPDGIRLRQTQTAMSV